MSEWSVINEDCVIGMAKYPDNHFDSVVTDPPYELGFMGKSWDNTGIAYKKEVWAEVMRVMKPGAHLLAFGGTRTYHRMACAIEDAGFEIRDQIQWLYGSGFPKSHNLEGEWDGWGTALKPANEPICIARKPLSESTVAANVLKWGTGAMNIEVSRIRASAEDQKKMEVGRKSVRTIRAGEVAKGYGMKPEGLADTEQSANGRWPANIILDEEAGKILDGQSGISKSSGGSGEKSMGALGKTKYGKYALDVKGANIGGLGDTGGASRFFYCAKVSQKERSGAGKNSHPTVKPIALMKYLIKLVTPLGGIVLDPFCGSGSTGCAAVRCKRRFVGIEKQKEYAEIARARIEAQEKEDEIENEWS